MMRLQTRIFLIINVIYFEGRALKLNKVMLSIAAALTVCSANAIAQENNEEAESSVERITVRGAFFGQQVANAVKTPTLLVNVPQSVSVVSAEQIAEQALFSVADVMQYTPGVSIGQGEDHRDRTAVHWHREVFLRALGYRADGNTERHHEVHLRKSQPSYFVHG